MPAHRSLLTTLLSLLVLPVVVVASKPGLAAEPSPTASKLRGVKSAPQKATVTVDAVSVTATTRFLPSSKFVLPKSGDLSQTASSSALSPFSQLSLTSVPYGTKPGTESLPRASQGATAQYRAQLQAVLRQQEGAQVSTGPFRPSSPSPDGSTGAIGSLSLSEITVGSGSLIALTSRPESAVGALRTF